MYRVEASNANHANNFFTKHISKKRNILLHATSDPKLSSEIPIINRPFPPYGFEKKNSIVKNNQFSDKRPRKEEEESAFLPIQAFFRAKTRTQLIDLRNRAIVGSYAADRSSKLW